MACSTFTVLCSLYLSLVLKHFRTLCSLSNHSLQSSLPQPPATSNLLSLPIGLPILEISYKWTYTSCLYILTYTCYPLHIRTYTLYLDTSLLCLPSFTHRNIFMVHPSCWVNSFLFICHSLFIYLFIDGHLDCSYLLVIISNVAVNICVQVCVPHLPYLSPYFSTSLPILVIFCFFLIIAILVGVKWYLIVVLICVS